MEAESARLVLIGFAGTEPDGDCRSLIARGVCQAIIFGRNITDAAGVARTCADLKSVASGPMAIAVDQEGGRVSRLTKGFTTVGEMADIGALGGAAAAAEAARVGALLARELRSVNIDIDFAPVVDVDSNPNNPVIGRRSFGADPARVADCARAFIEAMQGQGVAACAKHFPGHGDTEVDSHLDLPRLSHGMERLREVELPPFLAAISAGVASIMTAHVVFESLDPGVPATLSNRVVQGLLRDEMKFPGVIYSDCLEMSAIADRYQTGPAAVAAIAAGCDTVLVCHTPARQHEAIDAIVREAASSAAFNRRVAESSRRVQQLLAQYARAK